MCNTKCTLEERTHSAQPGHIKHPQCSPACVRVHGWRRVWPCLHVGALLRTSLERNQKPRRRWKPFPTLIKEKESTLVWSTPRMLVGTRPDAYSAIFQSLQCVGVFKDVSALNGYLRCYPAIWEVYAQACSHVFKPTYTYTQLFLCVGGVVAYKP